MVILRHTNAFHTHVDIRFYELQYYSLYEAVRYIPIGYNLKRKRLACIVTLLAINYLPFSFNTVRVSSHSGMPRGEVANYARWKAV